MRKIIHCDMDAFYASVEQCDDSRLRGKPVIVAWKGNRSVVCAASYEARAFGMHSAMPAKRAERLCPDGTFIAPNFTRYRAVSREVREIFKRHTDLIEPLSLDEAYLDITENKTGLPTASTDEREIEANQFAAELLMPRQFLDRDLEALPDEIEAEEAITRLAHHCEVSIQAMTVRLTALKILA